MTLARGSRALQGLGPSRPPGAGLQFLLPPSRFLSPPGPGGGGGVLGGVSPTPGCSAWLRETRSDENVFLQIKPSLDSPSGAGSSPGAQSQSWETAKGADAAAARVRYPTLHPRPLPPAPRVGSSGRRMVPTHRRLPERGPAVPLLRPPRTAEGGPTAPPFCTLYLRGDKLGGSEARPLVPAPGLP